MGSLRYEGRTFVYVECGDCGSAACDPMPEEALLARMYGPSYAELEGDQGVDDPKDPTRVIEWLGGEPPGLFLDFGCGKGTLLEAARGLGWHSVGVELDGTVAQEVSQQLGMPVLRGMGEVQAAALGPFDALHLGDVIEHLTEPADVVRNLLRHVKPQGLLLAQGPLEAGPSMFTDALRLWHRVRRPAPIAMAPYHVIQATVSGQRAFFARLGLQELEYRTSEVSWPAPSFLRPRDLVHPRAMILWLLRRLSMAWSRRSSGRCGNRYFYAGRRSPSVS